MIPVRAAVVNPMYNLPCVTSGSTSYPGHGAAELSQSGRLPYFYLRGGILL